MSKIQGLLPEFIAQVTQSLRNQGRGDLAEQLDGLELERWTYDAESDVGYVYLAGQRPLDIVEQNIIGSRYGWSIDIGAAEGIVVIDIDNLNRLTGIEIISRKDIVKELEKVCGSKQSS